MTLRVIIAKAVDDIHFAYLFETVTYLDKGLFVQLFN